MESNNNSPAWTSGMQESTGRRGLLDVGASICMVVASMVMVWYLARLGLDGAHRTGGGQPAGRQRPGVEEVAVGAMTVSTRGAPRLGHEGARVAMIEYSDFECPYCGRYARETFRALKREFVESGSLSYSYRYLPLGSIHPHAIRAAAAAGCADEQGRFWEMHTALFERQKFEDSDLLAGATQLGLDLPNFKLCLDRPEWDFQSQTDAANRLGISAVPTFLIGTLNPDGTLAVRRRINGAHPISVFESAVRAVMSTVGR